MKKLLLENKFFIIPFAVFLITALYFILIYSKIDIHIYINSHQNIFFNYIFKYITHFGSGIFAAIFVFALLFIKYKWAIIATISNLLISGIVQFLKRIVFPENNRPSHIFRYFYEGNYKLSIIEGTDPGIHYSFPSGHSATAFAIFFLIAIIVKNQSLKFFIFLFALLTAFSRVYLSWHFLQDTVAGSFIGFLITIFVFLFFEKYKNPWLEYSILKNHK